MTPPEYRRLWAPWRLGYIASARKGEPKGCLFCRNGKQSPGRRNLVVVKSKFSFSMLNKYPYNNGHLLIAPYRHCSRLDQLTTDELLDLFALANRSIQKIDKTLKPHGYNLGINMGSAAGAGIPAHIHLHIVPRWNGDTNFMPVIAGVKVISQSLESAHRLLSSGRAG
jgi:ATP adenylyltransferase